MSGRPYPTDPAERRRTRRDERDAAVARARDGYLVPFVTLKCAADIHADLTDGCANDGVSCLCDCHDRWADAVLAATERASAATPRPEGQR